MAKAKKRKYERGAATAFMSRNHAIKKLQLNLKDFRRICILKGIYPVEPKHKKTVGKGSTAPKTYYHVKDILFLANEPLINKFREFKHFVRRISKARAKRTPGAVSRISAHKPKYKLDHIVKERYPSFLDAVRDLEDCLSMCFLFATFPKTHRTAIELISLCRKLSVEFLHYVIASKSLRKVFVSIKGIYYQVELMGEKITWIIPHPRGYAHPTDVDYKIMQTFVQFYTTLLGFINFKMYHTINLHYPPKLELDTEEDDIGDKCSDFEKLEEKLAAMTQTLQSIGDPTEEEATIDDFQDADAENPDDIEKAKVQAESLKKLESLFKGLKIFINREVPRESLTFIIRCFGGQVSWENTAAVGSTYQETDATITHQIVDRPQIPNKVVTRYYVQPQWVYDCINARTLLPVDGYFIGAVLPPHLSPFASESPGDYIPPERGLATSQKGTDSGLGDDDEQSDKESLDEGDSAERDDDDGDDSDDKEEGDDDDEVDSEEEADENEEDSEDSSEEEDSDEEEDEEEIPSKRRKQELVKDSRKSKAQEKKSDEKKMYVQEGNIEKVDVKMKLKHQQNEERRLGEMMIPKKNRRLYNKIIHSQKTKAKEARKLHEKRLLIEKEKKAKSKLK